MHGGVPGSGALRGNQNARKHGRYTRAALQERQSVQGLLRQLRKRLQDIGWTWRILAVACRQTRANSHAMFG